MQTSTAPSKLETIGMDILFLVVWVGLFFSSISMAAFLVISAIMFVAFVAYRVNVEKRRRRHRTGQ